MISGYFVNECSLLVRCVMFVCSSTSSLFSCTAPLFIDTNCVVPISELFSQSISPNVLLAPACNDRIRDPGGTNVCRRALAGEDREGKE